MSFRTLHCANGTLYLLMSLAVLGCAAWGLASGRLTETWQIAGAALAAITALLWGGAYALLRWEIGPEGISRCLLRRRFYPWQSLKEAHAWQSEQNSISTCTLKLRFEEGELELSSQLLPLEELEQLCEELAAAGIIQPLEKATQE